MMSLPDPKRCATLLENLLGKSVTVEPGEGLPAPTVVAHYTADDGHRVVWNCDVALAAYVGAALSMIPPDAARESVAAGALEGSLLENACEVFNVASALFNNEGFAHVRLDRVFPPGADLPDGILPTGEARERADLSVEIENYGTGTLTLLAI